MNPDHLSSKLFYEGACGALATGSDTKQDQLAAPGPPKLNILRTGTFRLLSSFLLAGLVGIQAQANPLGGTVIHGDASFTDNGNHLIINQGSDRAIINWRDFSIGHGEITTFNMPSSSSAVLNRVFGDNLSTIFGTLNANGQVYLINPNGIVVGADGMINTQSFMASTLDVSDARFMEGNDLLFSGNSDATLINMGTIAADGGDVFLIARKVSNEGTITATDGTVGMAAGQEILLTRSGDQRLAVKLGGEGSSVDNAGHIQAIQAELKAVGNNPYALAVNNSGLIQANGVEEKAGRVYLSATGGTTSVSGSIIASGGEVQVLGDHVQLTDSARIDASGNEAGTILIGGDFQGKGDLQTAQTTTIEAGAQISADAHAGDGGRVIVWADGDTHFAGEISTRGAEGSRGGFVEVSGKQNLKFRGDVDTGGGTLLLDPTNIVIGDGADDTMDSETLIGLIDDNHVVLNTKTGGVESGDDVGNDEGNITVNTDIIYGFENADDIGTTYDLTFLAHNNIYFNASVQNRDRNGGDINIVSGWDGSTGFNVDTFSNANLESTTLFGNSNGGIGGSVFIGDGSQTEGINVGSRSGTTRIYANNLTLNGGGTNGHAQLGFRARNQGGNYKVHGDINISAKGDINAIAGSKDAYVQIGHVGRDFRGGKDDVIEEAVVENSDINLRTLGNITFEGGDGSEGAYALLGHGGENASGDFSGNITVEQSGDIHFAGGSGAHGAYAQLGHVGNEPGTDESITSNFSGSGNIDLVDVGSIIFEGGTGKTSYAQLGHGGENASGNHTGDITITDAGDITFNAGSNANAYAQLGHGGEDAHGSQSGKITILKAENIEFTAGSDSEDAYAQLGHGGRAGPASKNRHTSTLSGDITIEQAGDVSFTGGSERFNYAQLGHGGAELSGVFSGDISLNDVGNVSLTGGSGNNTYAQIGHGSGQSNYNHEFDDKAYGTRQGNITINSRGEITTLSGIYDDVDDAIDHDTAAVIGHYSSGVSAEEVGNPVSDSNVTITATGWNVDNGTSVFGEDISAMLAAAMAGGNVGISLTDTSLRLGNTSALNYDSSNDLTLLVRNDIHFDASLQNSNETGGNINVVAGWDAATAFDAETFDNSNLESTTLFGNSNGDSSGSVFIGDGNQTAGINVGSRSGTTRVYGNNLTLKGSDTNTDANAQLGYKVSDQGADYIVSGDIDVSLKGNLDATAGSEAGSYVQVGHVGKDVGGWDSAIEAKVNGADITLRALGSLNFQSSSGDGTDGGGTYGSYALLGHGGENASGDFNGNITVEQAGDINFTGGASKHGAFAQLGHVGNERINFNGSGNIDLVEVGSITFQGGTGITSYAQLGHGGENAIGTHSGDITIGTAGNLTFTAGSNANAYAQLGHGGEDANGTQFGNITINEAGDIQFTGGSAGEDAYAQLGHGGRSGPVGRNVSDLSGSITIGQAGNIGFTGGEGRFNYAQLGHGGAELSGGFSGDISLNDVGSVSLTGGSGNNTYAQIGHGSGQSNYNHEFDDKAYGTRQGNITINSRGEITTLSGIYDDVDDAIDHDTAAVIGHYSSGVSAEEVGNPVSDSNVTITATGWNVDNGTSVFGEDISAMLAAAMAGGNVGISLTDTSLRLGNTSALNYDSSNDLTLLVRNDIHFDASLQNSNETGGNINVVAGWDAATAFDAETFDNSNLESTTLFGNSNGANSGSVFIGDGNQTAGISVGSRSGATRVYGNDLTLKGSDTNTDAYAQLGYKVSDQGADYTVSGDIDVSLKGGLDATAGSEAGSYVQIGHVGKDAGRWENDREATVIGADITLRALGDLNFVSSSGDGTPEGGTYGSYALLGHGGENASGDFNGNITIEKAGDINFTGGASKHGAFAQLGHVGNERGNSDTNNFNSSGDIHLVDVGSIAFTGGTGFTSYAQLGHGGENANGTHAGNITITKADDITFSGGTERNAYAQLGHGGEDANGNQSGDITITKAGDIRFTAGESGDDAYAQLGHGGRSAPPVGSNSSYARPDSVLSGDITIEESGNLEFTGGGGRFAYAQLGHGGSELSGNFSGNISLNDVGNVSIVGGNGNNSYAQIGHGAVHDSVNRFKDPAKEFEHDDDKAYGLRQGNIIINSRGEILTRNGFHVTTDPSNTESHATTAAIGHSSSGVSAEEAGNPVSNSNVSITATGWNVNNNTSVFDESISAMLAAAMNGGNVSINLTGSDLQLGSALNYTSNNTLLLRSENGDVILGSGAGVNNAGTGDLVLAGTNFHNDSGSGAPLNSNGRWMVYSTNPVVNRNNTITDEILAYSTVFDPQNPVLSGNGSGFIYQSEQPEEPQDNNSGQLLNNTISQEFSGTSGAAAGRRWGLGFFRFEYRLAC
ncbi:filamentous hemagglutinin N-terminal domain-containing protein [Endozoicomonas lisbonensis]|uniref:two-partner secretion domain-containing protein n=1 Tax=Endozoicomonas lisbonensis TaxID=3120522 RepID=UPI0033909116